MQFLQKKMKNLFKMIFQSIQLKNNLLLFLELLPFTTNKRESECFN